MDCVLLRYMHDVFHVIEVFCKSHCAICYSLGLKRIKFHLILVVGTQNLKYCVVFTRSLQHAHKSVGYICSVLVLHVVIEHN
jgi:hypothetical protein